VTPAEVASGEHSAMVAEATGKNDGVPAERYMRGDELPWCAGFVLWCFEKAGFPLHEETGQYYQMRKVDAFELIMKKRNLWFPAHDMRSKPPKPNDILFLDQRGDSDMGPGRHMGIVHSVGPTRVRSYDGNWGNKVSSVGRWRADRSITGYARVDIKPRLIT